MMTHQCTMLNILILNLLIILSTYLVDGHIFEATLDTQGQYKLYWTVDYATTTIHFEIHLLKTWNWFAFGFSERGDFRPGDYCILWKNWKRQVQFQDVNLDEFGDFSVDEQQDCLDFQIQLGSKVTKFTFSRKFDTCDPKDFIIKDGTVHIVWLKGNSPLYNLNKLTMADQNEHGMIRVQLLKYSGDTNLNNELTNTSFVFDVLSDHVKVPNQETTYWCHVHKLPSQFKDKHHVVQFGPNIQKGNEGLVHHIEVFHCYAPHNKVIPMYAGSCFHKKRPNETQVCKRVLAAWAMGSKPLDYPEEAGLPFGGPDFNPYIMLEVHYNNPQLRNDWVDSSGIRFYMTSKLRSMDAGVMELGLEYTDKMAIPPSQKEFTLTGFCLSECTSAGLPPTGITVFASQLHTHLTGIKVVTRHIRDGIELNELNRDDYFSTHFQEIRHLKKVVKVLPGDALLTTCTYNTEDLINVTLGGFSISDEMCVNYVHYYPVTTLEVCKSSISDQALQTYFDYMQKWEYQKTNKANPISVNYKAIEWNPLRVETLKEVYREAPLSMQCNMSSGDRFPGYWENNPVTNILKPLPPPDRNCNTFVDLK